MIATCRDRNHRHVAGCRRRRLLIAATGAWVHRDAEKLAQAGSAVVLRSQLVTLDSPQDWTIASALGWVIFFPLYVIGRSRDE
jgi:hypothetical protein